MKLGDNMRDMIDVTLLQVLNMTWPTLFISLILIVTIRVGYLLKHRDEFVLYKEITYLCFMLYILCVFQVVTSQDINMTTGNNFRPFQEIFRYRIGTRLFYKNIIGNVLMFVPYGFFASWYIDLKKPFWAFLLIFIASLSIETTQLWIGRIFDVDDIILNVVGGMIGYILYYTVNKICSLYPKILKNEWFLNIMTILILIIAIVVVFWR